MMHSSVNPQGQDMGMVLVYSGYSDWTKKSPETQRNTHNITVSLPEPKQVQQMGGDEGRGSRGTMPRGTNTQTHLHSTPDLWRPATNSLN